MLRAELRLLQAIEKLPDVLSRLGLPYASVALIYALGHEDKLPLELFESSAGTDEKYKFFKLWRDQLAAADLPEQLNLYDTQTITLNSYVAGCKIVVNCWNESPCLELEVRRKIICCESGCDVVGMFAALNSPARLIFLIPPSLCVLRAKIDNYDNHVVTSSPSGTQGNRDRIN